MEMAIATCCGHLDDAALIQHLLKLHPSRWTRFTTFGNLPADLPMDAAFAEDPDFCVRDRQILTAPNGPPLAVYRQPDTEVVIAFREIPAATFVVAWDLEVKDYLLVGSAYTPGGELLTRRGYWLGPGWEVRVQDLHDDALKAALAARLVESQNQKIQMFLKGGSVPLPSSGILWSHWASFAPPSKRINAKTDASNLRLRLWQEALNKGLLHLEDGPVCLL